MKKKWKRHAFRAGKHVQILRSMKLCVLLLVLAVTNVLGVAKSQTLTLEVKEGTLKEVFQLIEQHSSWRFLYKSDEIEGMRVQALKVENLPIEKVLQHCFRGLQLSYEIDDQLIIVKRKPMVTMPQKMKTLTGTVHDRKGNPLPGVTVLIKGASLGVATDVEGNFKMEIPDADGLELVFSYIGMKSRTLPYRGEQTLDVVLEEDVSEMDEVVVTGYQTLTRREMASAVSQVKASDIMLNNKFSVDQMLAGQVAGMSVMQTSGEPGATPKIRIRGTSSIIGNKAPLWVLDGIILDDPVQVDYSQLNGDDAAYLIGNAISGVNPRDIETITVLKDASATAIYGVQAANGVIVVTTKKGKAGKTRISYNAGLTFDQRVSYGDLYLMNATERIQLSEDIIANHIEYKRVPRNLGYEGLYMDYLDKKYSYAEFTGEVRKMADRNTDWYDLLFRNAVSHNHTLSMSGGNDKTTFYASIGYADQEGTAKGSDSKRYTANLKISSWLNDKVYLGAQLNTAITQSKGFHSSFNPNKYAYETSRTVPCYDDNGDLFFYETTQYNLGGDYKEPLTYNALYEQANTGQSGKLANITGKMDFVWRIWKGFRYELTGSYIYQQSKSESYARPESNYVSTIRGYNMGSILPNSTEEANSSLPYGGVISKGEQEQTSYMVRNTIGYSNQFADDHVLSVMAISEIKSTKNKGFSGTYYGWFPDRGQTINPVLTNGYINKLSSLRPTITDNVVNVVSWIGSASYSYKDKYTLNGNVRMDGSNQFGENPKYRFLPIWSAAAKYTLTNESFMKDLPVLSYLSVRGSYGIQGNVDKATAPQLVIQVGAMDNLTRLDESYFKYLPNADLRWEKTKSYNLGIDFALWDGRISGTFDYYKKKGEDMIMSRAVSQVVGQDYVKINAGKLENTGYEANLVFFPVKTDNWELSVNIIYSYNQNKLTDANGGKEITIADQLSGQALVTGEPLGTFYSYAFAGLNRDTGFPTYYDKNGHATFTNEGQEYPNYSLYADELYVVKSGVRQPSSTGGFDFNLRYKNWRLGMGFQYALGGHERLPEIYQGEYANIFDPLVNVTKEFKDRWQKPGDESRTMLPVLYDDDTYKALPHREWSQERDRVEGLQMFDRSSARVAKTDNLRMRSLSLSYLFPEKWTQRAGIQDLMLSFQASNLFLISDKRWHGRDPESGGSNTPLPKSYSLNLNISF